MNLGFFNTLTRRVEAFTPLQNGHAGIYSCGPTVYDRAHIGNLRSFLFVDLLKRWLESNSLSVMHVMNLTDVDDKTIRRSREKGVTLRTLTDQCAEQFFSDLEKLGIKPATHYPRATEHIPEMVELIKKLLASDHAYTKDGSVYYRITSFASYGQLAQLDTAGMKAGASGVDVDEYGKNDARDFVLWKAYKPEEDGEVFWDTEIGRGRPGWHIECSAMSMKYLGPTLDFHTGGVDLIFPHHQNEIAQSEGATGQRFVNYWLHSEHLLFGGNKMAKSAGTVRNLDEIAKTPLDAAAFRYLMLAQHYRAKLNFTDLSLESARNTTERLWRLHSSLRSVKLDGDNQLQELATESKTAFKQALENDLNTPQALAVVFGFVSHVEKKLNAKTLTTVSAASALDFLNMFDSIFGVLALEVEENTDKKDSRELEPELQALITGREQARAEKEWQRADEIRKTLLTRGIALLDTKEGTKWERI